MLSQLFLVDVLTNELLLPLSSLFPPPSSLLPLSSSLFPLSLPLSPPLSLPPVSARRRQRKLDKAKKAKASARKFVPQIMDIDLRAEWADYAKLQQKIHDLDKKVVPVDRVVEMMKAKHASKSSKEGTIVVKQ